MFVNNNKNINSLEVLFRTEQRRRLGVVKNTISRLIELYDKENEGLETNYKLENGHKPELVDCCPFTKNNFYDRLAIIQNDDRYLCKSDISKYDGTDIEIFNEKKNYYTWQLKLEELLFTHVSVEINIAGVISVVAFAPQIGIIFSFGF